MSEELEPLLNQSLAVHEALRRMGVEPEHIFLSVYGDGLAIEVRSTPPRGCAALQIFARRGGSFDTESVRKLWAEKVHWWNTTSTQAERVALWNASYVARNAARFALSMIQKGFKVQP